MAQNFDPNNNSAGGFNPQGGFTPDPNFNPGGGFDPNAQSGGFDPNAASGGGFAPDPYAQAGVDPYASGGSQAAYPNDPYATPGGADFSQSQGGFTPDPYGGSQGGNFGADPYAQNGGGFAPDPYAQAGVDSASGGSQAAYPNDPYTTPGGGYDSGFNNTPQQSVDPYAQKYADPSFEVKKSGSRTFLVVGVVVVLLLLTGTFGVIFAINQGWDIASLTGQSSSSESSQQEDVDLNQSSESSSVSSEPEAEPDNAGTPAARAKVYSEEELPLSWVSEKFNNNDTDANGNCLNENTCGESADPDDDGLSNIDEYNYNTDPIDEDSDNDGISDGNEVYVYFSHPRLIDSDDDGDQDDEEIVACTDPIVDDTDKISTDRRDKLAENIEIWSLTEPTISTLQDGEATEDDLELGYVSAACEVEDTDTDTDTEDDTDGGVGIEF
jgi:hypothetical protein